MSCARARDSSETIRRWPMMEEKSTLIIIGYGLRAAGYGSPVTDGIYSRGLKSVARSPRYRPKIRPQKPRFFGCSGLGAGGVEAAPGVLLATLPVADG